MITEMMIPGWDRLSCHRLAFRRYSGGYMNNLQDETEIRHRTGMITGDIVPLITR
jgi:hypothetical protein